jgi:hypothetical protein
MHVRGVPVHENVVAACGGSLIGRIQQTDFQKQLAEFGIVKFSPASIRSTRQYLPELEQQNPIEEPVHQQDQVSTTDPDSTYATKGGTPARLGYYDNYLVDNPSCVIVGVQATAARMSQETVAEQDSSHGSRNGKEENPRP